MFEARELVLTEKELIGIYDLLHLVFPRANHFSKEYLKWLYLDNPNGQAVGANVFDGKKVVAHYVMQAISAVIHGVEEKALLVLNIATHPDYRGRRLFKLAGQKALEQARAQGYGHVIAVANGNSTKAFKHQLGFELIGSLDVKLGVGRMPGAEPGHNGHYRVNWSHDALSWRTSRPGQFYFLRNTGAKREIYSPLGPMGCSVKMGDYKEEITLPPCPVQYHIHPGRLWVGLDSSRNWKGCSYIDVPDCFKPSPLNFIFYDLRDSRRRLEKKHIRFDALDFDAY